MNISKSLLNKLLLVGLMAGAVLLRFWHLNWGLPDIYEETYPFSIAWQMWNWGNPGIDLNPHFFNYPSFTIYLNFIVQGIHFGIGYIFGLYPTLQAFQDSYQADPTVHIILARMISAVFDTGTIFILWKFGSLIGGNRLGFLAAGIGALNPMLVQHAHFVAVDTPLAFFSIASLYYLYRLSLEKKPMYYYMSGLCIGLAAASKYTGALLLLILALVHVVDGRKDWLAFLKHVFDAHFIKGAVIAVAVFFVLNPYIILAFGEFLLDFRFEEQHMSSGHLGADPSVMTFAFYLFQVFPNAFGWIVYIVCIGAIVALVVTRKKENIVLVLFPVLYMAVISTWQMRADRYVLPVVPVLILIGSVGILMLVDRLLALPTVKRYRYGFVPLVILLAMYEPVSAVARYHQSIGLPDTRVIAKQWISSNLSRGSSIALTSMRVKFPDKTYQVLSIPFFPVLPERVEPYYDTRWYEDFDLVMGSDFDLGRYQQDPKRYAKFLNFYETLNTKWTLVHEVKPEGNQSGPTIWLYRLPDSLRLTSFPNDLFKPFYRTDDSSECGVFLQIISVIMMKKRQMEKAVQAVSNLAFFEPDNLEQLRMLLTLFKEGGRLERAIPVADSYLRQRPKNAELLCLNGWIYYTLKRYEMAENFFKQALVCDPNYGSAYTDLFTIYSGRKDKGKAIDILMRYLAILTPGSEKARTIQSYIDEIKTY